MDTEVNVKTTKSEEGDPKPVPTPIIVHRKGPLDRVPWQRLALSLIGILIITLIWERGTNHLYSLPEYSIGHYVTWSINAMYAIAAMVVFFVTGKLIYDWKNNTVTTLTQVAQQAYHKSIALDGKYDPKIEQKYATMYADDPSYRPIETVPDMNVETFR